MKDEWVPVDGAENLPLGNWLVTVVERGNKASEVHVAKVRDNFITVGNCFSFDMPKVIAYMSTPEVYKS